MKDVLVNYNPVKAISVITHYINCLYNYVPYPCINSQVSKHSLLKLVILVGILSSRRRLSKKEKNSSKRWKNTRVYLFSFFYSLWSHYSPKFQLRQETITLGIPKLISTRKIRVAMATLIFLVLHQPLFLIAVLIPTRQAVLIFFHLELKVMEFPTILR